jgi:NADPH2:quinone reductase
VKAWRVHEYGRPSEALQLDEIDAPEPAPGQLLVDVSATVLNFNDIDGCYGRYRTVNPPLPYVAGMEVVGRVTAAGPGGEAWIGKRVMGTPPGAFGGYAEQAVTSADMTFEAPARLSDSEAAAFFFPFHLAYLGLHERGGLATGESVLIHAAAGGVGSAAVQLALAAGARVLATAGGPEKVDFCRNLGADVAIDYRADDFAEAVLDATDGRGVDLIFDTVGGEITQRSFRCIARNGRHLMVGFSGGIEAEDESKITPRPIVFGNFALAGVILAYTSHPEAAKRASGFNLVPRSVGEQIHEHLLALLEAKRIRPVIGRVVSFAEIPSALEALEQRRTRGRVVVTL